MPLSHYENENRMDDEDKALIVGALVLVLPAAVLIGQHIIGWLF